MVEKLGLHKQVEFIDWLARADTLKAFADANLFLYPSFESGGIVALEATALGVPIITLDYAGSGSMVKAVGARWFHSVAKRMLPECYHTKLRQ